MLGIKRQELRIVKKIQLENLQHRFAKKKYELAELRKNFHCVQHSKRQKFRSVQKFEKIRSFELFAITRRLEN